MRRRESVILSSEGLFPLVSDFSYSVERELHSHSVQEKPFLPLFVCFALKTSLYIWLYIEINSSKTPIGNFFIRNFKILCSVQSFETYNIENSESQNSYFP